MSAPEVRCSVFLLAQNRLLREALTRILDRKADLQVIGSCALSSLALQEICNVSPGIVVMDSLLGGDSRSSFIRELQQCAPGIKILVISMDADAKAFLQAVREGVAGFVLKDASSAEIVAAVRAVARGEAVCPNELCQTLFEYVARQGLQLPSFQVRVSLGLTNREQKLMQLVSRGLTNKEIASELNLAEQTVRNHVHRVLRKTGTSDRFAAVEICRIQGLPV
jgi:DNA-binding NarL/FixJ family response regulator